MEDALRCQRRWTIFKKRLFTATKNQISAISLFSKALMHNAGPSSSSLKVHWLALCVQSQERT